MAVLNRIRDKCIKIAKKVFWGVFLFVCLLFFQTTYVHTLLEILKYAWTGKISSGDPEVHCSRRLGSSLNLT